MSTSNPGTAFSGLRRRLHDGTTVFTASCYTLALIYLAILLIPLYYIIVSALKSNAEIFGSALSLPSRITLENFLKAERSGHLIRALVVSLLITASAEVLVLALGFPAAYAIARIRTKLAGWVAAFFSTGFLIPAFAMMVPVLMLISRMGLLYNPLALVVFYPAWRLPFTIVVLVSYLRTVPLELEESAEIDGATRLQMLIRIFVPLVRPGVITVIILNFITIWNEFLFALILLSQQNRTLQIAVSILKGERLTDYGMLAAGVLMSIVPVIAVFLIFQKRVIGGLYSGAVKG